MPNRGDLLFPKSGAAFRVDFFDSKHGLKVVFVKRLKFGKPDKKDARATSARILYV